MQSWEVESYLCRFVITKGLVTNLSSDSEWSSGSVSLWRAENATLLRYLEEKSYYTPLGFPDQKPEFRLDSFPCIPDSAKGLSSHIHRPIGKLNFVKLPANHPLRGGLRLANFVTAIPILFSRLEKWTACWCRRAWSEGFLLPAGFSLNRISHAKLNPLNHTTLSQLQKITQVRNISVISRVTLWRRSLYSLHYTILPILQIPPPASTYHNQIQSCMWCTLKITTTKSSHACSAPLKSLVNGKRFISQGVARKYSLLFISTLVHLLQLYGICGEANVQNCLNSPKTIHL